MQAGEEYWDLFFDEVNTHLESLNQELSNLEKKPSDLKIINEIFRLVHTVKGMAATIGFTSISKLCHRMEELFDYYRKHPQTVANSSLECEIKCLDSLFKIVDYISSNGEEVSICKALSDAVSEEIEEEIKKVNSAASEPPKEKPAASVSSGSKKKIEVKVKFAEDCLMPGVRAFITTQVLEKNGELIKSDPPQEDFLESTDLVAHGLTALLNSSKPVNQLKERLMKISDVIEVEIRDAIEEPVGDSLIDSITSDLNDLAKQQDNFQKEILRSAQAQDAIYSSGECPAFIVDKIPAKQKDELVAGTLNIFFVDLYLADEVINPEEQFYNLLTNLNDYIGLVVYSVPELMMLKEQKDKVAPPENISKLISAEISAASNKEAKARRRIQFVLLISGNHKNVLDFLSDACELNKVEVKEMKLPQDEKVIIQKEEKPSGAEIASSDDGKDNAPMTKHSDIKTTFVRVNLATLEALMNSVGELVINHNRIKLAMSDNPTSEMRSITQYLNQVTTKIQQLVMSIRMVPVNQVFNRFPRFIRDVARDLKKEVNLQLEGEETEIDRLMVDELNDIFIHLVRNAIDHGIEKAEEREKNGKPRAGLIKLQAYSQGNQVFVTITDDGKGIDPKTVKTKAIQKGLLTVEQAEMLTTEELLNLIFTSGFSTAEVVSDLSGRGVGMDVVKGKISSLGGQITITSQAGEGTSVKLSIPSTISIIQALLINDLGGLYAIPLSEIKEIVTIDTWKSIYKIGNCDIMVLHGQTIPLIHLGRYIDFEQSRSHSHELSEFAAEQSLVIVIMSEGKPYGLLIDSLVGQQEIVIKPISNRANQEGLINGATVFGDGRVAMILNVDQIIKIYMNDYDLPSDVYEGNPANNNNNDFDAKASLMGK